MARWHKIDLNSEIKQKPIGAIEIGKYPNGLDELAHRVIEVLKKAGFIAIFNSDILRTIWGWYGCLAKPDCRFIESKPAVATI